MTGAHVALPLDEGMGGSYRYSTFQKTPIPFSVRHAARVTGMTYDEARWLPTVTRPDPDASGTPCLSYRR
jgi:hypothetical protein